MDRFVGFTASRSLNVTRSKDAVPWAQRETVDPSDETAKCGACRTVLFELIAGFPRGL